jgi:hypothetical protein
MNKPEESQSIASEQVVYEPCPCQEIANAMRKFLGISPAVQMHLTNSRVEFLKAVREILNERIEYLSSQGQKGTKVAVE